MSPTAHLTAVEMESLAAWKQRYTLRLDEVFTLDEMRRLRFARWLAATGRLDEFATLALD